MAKQEMPNLRISAHYVFQVTFSPDGRHIAAQVSDPMKPYEVKVWDTSTGEELATLKGSSGTISHAAFSPDGRPIATCTAMSNAPRGEVKLWDIASGRELLTLKTSDRKRQLAFNSDGTKLFTTKDFHHDPGDLVATWDATPLPDSDDR